MTNNTFAERLTAQSDQLKIGIIGAMDEEVELLKQRLETRQAHTIAGYRLYTGTLHGVDVVLLKSGIGKVNAAIGTTLMLQTFQPTCVINTGSAGGFADELNVGDVVICDEVRHHDVDVTIFGYEHGQVPGLPAGFMPDNFLVDVAQRSIAQMDGIKTVKGLIATGDSFMNCPTRVAQTREHFPAMKAVEMEAAAIAQTCYQFDIPFIVIRALSDIAGKESNLSFDQFLLVAAKHSAQMVIAMVQTIANETHR